MHVPNGDILDAIDSFADDERVVSLTKDAIESAYAMTDLPHDQWKAQRRLDLAIGLYGLLAVEIQQMNILFERSDWLMFADSMLQRCLDER